MLSLSAAACQGVSDLAQNLSQLTETTNRNIADQQGAATQAKNAVDDMNHSVVAVAESAAEAARVGPEQASRACSCDVTQGEACEDSC